MRKFSPYLLTLLSLLIFHLETAQAKSNSESISQSQETKTSTTSAPLKEWTMLVFLNGNNNLDRYGKMNVNLMEKVGSTDQINVVVQWASLRNGSTKRLLIQKDNDPNNVTSPVVQDMGRVDMGDWKNLVEFVRWGVEKYPAKHYFIDVWDHGSGWHMLQTRQAVRADYSASDISWDDNTGNFISTIQLGQALDESAKIIGHKVDLYGSDACLMSMAEVAYEMKNSVATFAGSEEVEPAEGWPYDALLTRWASAPDSTGAEVGKILTDEYMKAYSGGQYGTRSVTFSILDIGKMDLLTQAITQLGKKLASVSPEQRPHIVKAVSATQSYTYSDYGDIGDFLNNLESQGINGLDKGVIRNVGDAVKEFVLENQTSAAYARSTGVAMWLPSYKSVYNSYASRYEKLGFHQQSRWGDALKSILQ